MKRRGLTLLELLVVLTILISLATIIVPTVGTFGRKSQEVATRENLLRLHDLINNRYMADMDNEFPRPKNLVGPPVRVNHPQLRYLFVNPDTEDVTKTDGATLLSPRRWQGPYVKHSGARYDVNAAKGFVEAYGVGNDSTTGFGGDPAILDAWGRPVVLQEPNDGVSTTTNDKTYARLVSAGPNGVIDMPLTVLMPDATQRGDDIIVFLFRHDLYGPDYLKLEQ